MRADSALFVYAIPPISIPAGFRIFVVVRALVAAQLCMLGGHGPAECSFGLCELSGSSVHASEALPRCQPDLGGGQLTNLNRETEALGA